MKVPKRRYSKTANRPSLEQYFNDITSSKEAAANFIINDMAAYPKERGYRPSNSYYTAMAKATNIANKSAFISNKNYNYNAFIDALAKFGMTRKDICYLWAKQFKAAQQELLPANMLRNAVEVFAEKTASEESVKNFMVELAQYPNKPKVSRERQKYLFTYSKWFRDHTNAKGIRSTHKLNPTSVDWSSFVQTCNKKFNYTSRDLTRFFREAE